MQDDDTNNDSVDLERRRFLSVSALFALASGMSVVSPTTYAKLHSQASRKQPEMPKPQGQLPAIDKQQRIHVAASHDSTNIGSSSSCKACHSSCHASRGWR